MPLDAGVRLGPYEIVSALGAEGAEESYKASDTEKNRTVTITRLPPQLSENSELRLRFEREVKALSGLSHPHICTPHEIHREGDTDFLVTEFVEGETVAKRLERGALPLDEAVKAALAIVDALNKAHRAGLVHRNLRPPNLMLTADGGVKLLDFGMTKTDPPKEEAPPASDIRSKATLPDLPDDIVRYMAPEQVEGRDADARSDIFAFGAVFYEMVTGHKAFEGKNRPVLLASIATLDPDPLSKAQPDAPATLDHVVQRCLTKNPDGRWQTAHDLLVQLRWVADGGGGRLAASRARQKRERRMLAVVAVALFLVAAAATRAAISWGGAADSAVVQFRVPVAGLNPADIAISPDGALLALVAKPNASEPASLFVRPVGATEFRKLVGTEGSAQPFWAPDSQSIGFFAGGRLKRVASAGGAPKDLGEAPGFMGGAWSTGGVILFGSAKGLYRVSAEGGTPELVTALEKQETGHYWPSFLPDAQHYLYSAWSAEPAARAVFGGTLGAKERTRVMAGETNAAYAEPGYILFHRQATLFALPFDVGSRMPSGEPLHIADQLDINPANGRGSFDVSQNGALIYFQSGGNRTAQTPGTGGAITNDLQFAWVTREGKQLALIGQQGRYGDVDVTQDGKTVAFSRQDVGSPSFDIWTLNQVGAWFKLTLDPADDFNPVFSPDGTRIAFTSYRKGNADIYIKPANGSADEVPLVDSPANEFAEDWSKDDKYLFYKSGDNSDIYALPMTGEKKPMSVVLGPFQKDEPQLSYDGKWLAYTTNQSGAWEVYVRSFPAGDDITTISTGGGGQPRWRKDGKELFYRVESRTMVVEIKPGARFEAGPPKQLFGPLVDGTMDRDPIRHVWNVSPDGSRMFMRVPLGQGGQTNTQGGTGGINFNAPSTILGTASGGQAFVSSGLTVIQNWTAAFQKVTP